MKMLLPGEVKGYVVRKQAKDVKLGDIVYCGNFIVVVKEIKFERLRINLISEDKSMDNCDPKVFLTCIQKEDPAIQIAIEAKLEVLRKHKLISVSSNNHEVLRNGDRLTISGEWIKQGRPYQWSIIETDGKYEYWEDNASDGRVLWAGNKIIAWSNDKKALRMHMLISKEGVCVFDKPTYDLPKYIWR